MLNRRYLRIKVYQALYAFWQSEDASPARSSKELIKGIDRVHELYIALMLTFGELRHVAGLRIDERKRKRLPTPEDLNPNMRFVEDPVLAAIVDDPRLQAEAARLKISWVGFQEIFVRMMRDIEAHPDYQAFMTDPSPGIRKSRNFMVTLLTDWIANSPALQEEFENRSIHWMEDLDLAAALAKRTIEQIEEGRPMDLMRGPDTEEEEFVTKLFEGTIRYQQEHEEAVAGQASNWEAERIALTDMILMQMALTEVRTFEQIPVKVTLNEYIEIAKAYSTPKSRVFINGVLDKLFTAMKADGRIRKVGRGLLET